MRRAAVCIALLCAACAAAPTPTPDVTRQLDEGRAHLALYEWDRAIDALNGALDADPGRAEAYCLRGLAYASSPGGAAARDAAIADYTHCLELDPSGPLAEGTNRALTALRAAAGP